MSVLVTPRGDPAPPAQILRCLQAVSPRLSLKWLNTGGGAWAIMCQWSDVDSRRETVRQGLTSEEDARDVLAYLPPDCSVDDARNYFELACFRGYGGTNADEVRALMANIRAWNDTQHLRNAESSIEYAAEIAPTFAPSIGEELGHRVVRVAQREPGKRKHLLPKDRAPGEL